MRLHPLVSFCRSLPQATEDIKWKKDRVFSIGDKMFACFGTDDSGRVSFKTTPANFTLLTQNVGVIPAPYAARYLWALVESLDALPLEIVRELIQESYDLVVAKLPAKKRRALGLEGSEQSSRG